MIAQATRCYDCGSYVSRDIYFGRFGKRNNVPLWVCPNCGVVHEDYRWFKYVSQQEANAIIEHRGPRGLFVLETGVEYIGIDNSTGDGRVPRPDGVHDVAGRGKGSRSGGKSTEKIRDRRRACRGRGTAAV